VRRVSPLREFLASMSPATRERLRAVLVRDIADRDGIDRVLTSYGDRNGEQWSEILDLLAERPELRRDVVRELGELAASA
jgi:hypothetical protein